MDLREPIPLDHTYPDNKIVSNLLLSSRPDSTILFKQIICQMYIGCQTLQLGSEARFTSIVLFHRYSSHYLNNLYQTLFKNIKVDYMQSENVDLDGNYLNGTITKDINNNNNTDEKRNKMIETQIRKQLDDPEEYEHLSIVAAACLFLGCKLAGEPRRIRDVLNIVHMISSSSSEPITESISCIDTTKCDQNENTTNINNKAPNPKNGPNIQKHSTSQLEPPIQQQSKNPIIISLNHQPPELDESYWKRKELLVTTEQHVLRALKFDVNVSQPFNFIIILLEQMIAKQRQRLQKKQQQLLLLHQQDHNHDVNTTDNNHLQNITDPLNPGVVVVPWDQILQNSFKTLNSLLFSFDILSRLNCVYISVGILSTSMDECISKQNVEYLKLDKLQHYVFEDLLGLDLNRIQYAKDVVAEAISRL